ncbi:MAG TPA: sigma-E factor negative regulatory protein [Burkholderiales bacterium]|nr:sigma-E factor negative regulatory protein [Burkholderiales bacterium]
MKDRISALMDGELDERSAAEVIDLLGRGGEALQAWRSYHLIGDSMRDSRLLSEGFGERLRERLAAEPTVLAPARLAGAQRRRLALPVAASAAAVALVAWLAFAPQPPQSPQQQLVPQVAQAKPPVAVPLPSSANDYLLAHQGFSPRIWLQGVAPYVRTVSDQAQEPRR